MFRLIVGSCLKNDTYLLAIVFTLASDVGVRLHVRNSTALPMYCIVLVLLL